MGGSGDISPSATGSVASKRLADNTGWRQGDSQNEIGVGEKDDWLKAARHHHLEETLQFCLRSYKASCSVSSSTCRMSFQCSWEGSCFKSMPLECDTFEKLSWTCNYSKMWLKCDCVKCDWRQPNDVKLCPEILVLRGSCVEQTSVPIAATSGRTHRRTGNWWQYSTSRRSG